MRILGLADACSEHGIYGCAMCHDERPEITLNEIGAPESSAVVTGMPSKQMTHGNGTILFASCYTRDAAQKYWQAISQDERKVTMVSWIANTADDQRQLDDK